MFQAYCEIHALLSAVAAVWSDTQGTIGDVCLWAGAAHLLDFKSGPQIEKEFHASKYSAAELDLLEQQRARWIQDFSGLSEQGRKVGCLSVKLFESNGVTCCRTSPSYEVELAFVLMQIGRNASARFGLHLHW